MDDKKFLKNLFNFLNSDSGETLKELKDELEEEGIDFDLAQGRLIIMLKDLGRVCSDCGKPVVKTNSNDICYCSDKW